jgi:hypothetical protein
MTALENLQRKENGIIFTLNLSPDMFFNINLASARNIALVKASAKNYVSYLFNYGIEIKQEV